jgi:hypothetical protein
VRTAFHGSAEKLGVKGLGKEANPVEDPKASSKSRRDFIAKCGRFAVVTPPTIALMLSAADRNYAHAFSGMNHREREENRGKGRGHENNRGKGKRRS